MDAALSAALSAAASPSPKIPDTGLLPGLLDPGVGALDRSLARSRFALCSALVLTWLLYPFQSLKQRPPQSVQAGTCAARWRCVTLSRTCCLYADSDLNFWPLQMAQVTGGMVVDAAAGR